jgi:hypothetical protein
MARATRTSEARVLISFMPRCSVIVRRLKFSRRTNYACHLHMIMLTNNCTSAQVDDLCGGSRICERLCCGKCMARRFCAISRRKGGRPEDGVQIIWRPCYHDRTVAVALRYTTSQLGVRILCGERSVLWKMESLRSPEVHLCRLLPRVVSNILFRQQHRTRISSF